MTVDPRRAEVAALLPARWEAGPADAREERSLDLFAAAVDELERPFDRDADPTHVTSSAIVTGPAGVLLVHHRRLAIWVQPGGHLEPDEDLAAGALREAVEETGLRLRHPLGGPRMVHVDVHPGGAGHRHLDLRWLLVGTGPPHPPPGESQLVQWFDWDEAEQLADPGLSGGLRVLRHSGLIF